MTVKTIVASVWNANSLKSTVMPIYKIRYSYLWMSVNISAISYARLFHFHMVTQIYHFIILVFTPEFPSHSHDVELSCSSPKQVTLTLIYNGARLSTICRAAREEGPWGGAAVCAVSTGRIHHAAREQKHDYSGWSETE